MPVPSTPEARPSRAGEAKEWGGGCGLWGGEGPGELPASWEKVRAAGLRARRPPLSATSRDNSDSIQNDFLSLLAIVAAALATLATMWRRCGGGVVVQWKLKLKSVLWPGTCAATLPHHHPLTQPVQPGHRAHEGGWVPTGGGCLAAGTVEAQRGERRTVAGRRDGAAQCAGVTAARACVAVAGRDGRLASPSSHHHFTPFVPLMKTRPPLSLGEAHWPAARRGDACRRPAIGPPGPGPALMGTGAAPLAEKERTDTWLGAWRVWAGPDEAARPRDQYPGRWLVKWV